MKRKVKIVVFGLFITCGVVGAVFAVKSSQSTDKVQAVASQSVGKTKGSAIAPIRIVEFSDFQCPACRNSVPVLKELIQKYPGKIQVIFKHLIFL